MKHRKLYTLSSIQKSINYSFCHCDLSTKYTFSNELNAEKWKSKWIEWKIQKCNLVFLLFVRMCSFSFTNWLQSLCIDNLKVVLTSQPAKLTFFRFSLNTRSLEWNKKEKKNSINFIFVNFIIWMAGKMTSFYSIRHIFKSFHEKEKGRLGKMGKLISLYRIWDIVFVP